LVPFGDETADILMWYMGTRIRPSDKDDMISWIKQVKSADRRFNRPLAADITGLERVFTRYVNLAGMSRHSLNSSFDPVRQREWLSEKRKLARLGSFMWTWVQTESSVSNESERTVAGAGMSGAVIEPEQIWLQVYSALAAGYRGVGFWKRESLGADTPGVLERRLAIALVNRELELLEPLLATGMLLGPVDFTISAQKVQSVGQLGANLNSTSAAKRARVALLRERSASQRRNQQLKHELQAAVIKSRYGHLVLPIWYQTDAQFVPGKMSARSATVVVPSVPETATAWQVTASGLRSLEKRRTNAGLEVTLKDFDQRAAILITSDNAFRVAMDGKIKSLSESRASLSVELAEAKLKRVRGVDAELTALGVGQPDAPHLLGSAGEWAGEARRYLGQGDFGSAHMSSMDCMKALRRLQRAHWDQAIEKLSAPTSSVHATCFQTLPAHWRMIAKLGRARSKLDGNLLRGGDFEDIEVMVAERWQHHQQETEAVRATAELYPLKTGQGSCLRLMAVPEAGSDPPSVVHQSPVSVISPSIHVRAGQVVHISGLLRIPVPTTANLDGVTLYDTLGGASAALRWQGPQGWRRFELIREVDHDREFVVRITLNGLGEVKVDDLRIVAFDPPGPVNSNASAGNRPASGESRRSALDFLPRLHKLRPLQPRN
ncbi:MAG: hypothetical protein CMJ48_13565, partial [Planctomycetaceae bacterium]|nr:hypothetical protein [Planctomycetaceae bacterium]